MFAKENRAESNKIIALCFSCRISRLCVTFSSLIWSCMAFYCYLWSFMAEYGFGWISIVFSRVIDPNSFVLVLYTEPS